MASQCPKVYASLSAGIDLPIRGHAAVREWFSWRDGQLSPEGKELFGDYMFIPSGEALSYPKQMRKNCSAIQLLGLGIFARRALYSWPLLIDLTGDGYYYSAVSRRVFYKFEGERDTVFPQFEHFVDLLVELLRSGVCDDGESRYELELKLLDQIANR